MAKEKHMNDKLPKVWDVLDANPRVKRQVLENPKAVYMGCCIVQAPGAWCRLGATWYIPDLGWVCVGPGIDRWGTTMGLAEIATFGSPQTTWHATGIGISQLPNIVFACTQQAIDSGNLSWGAEYHKQVEEYYAKKEGK